ncbi:MAG: nucleoside triphosphate pyrophosphohydrolase [Caldisericia bacterium]
MNYSWIIENEVMISSLPDSETMLHLLKSAGIRAIVSAERIPFTEEILEEYGFFHYDLPIIDYSVPTLKQLKDFIRWTKFMKDMNQPILIHCMAGYGRSATLCACYLVIEHDMTADDAIKEIREIRSMNAVETSRQENFVHEAEYLRDVIKDEDEQRFYNCKAMVDVLRKRCPWDKEQTSDKLANNILEESYEVTEAALSKNTQALVGELADIFLLTLMIIRVESETSKTSFKSVMDLLLTKFKNRHPHVFDVSGVDTPDKVVKQWREIKKEEPKDFKTIADIPTGIPPLGRADRIMSFAKKQGFDWPDVSGVLQKVDEEISELKTAIKLGNTENIENEFGDVFFSMLNLARFLWINPENTLTKTLDKFTSRFHFIEQKSETLGKPISDMTLDEMEEIWQKSKTEMLEN